jgi:hypothetical protein
MSQTERQQEERTIQAAVQVAALFNPALRKEIEKAAAILEESAEQPKEKETDEIKKLLAAFVKLRKRIDNTEKRLEALELSVGASTPSYSGMPGGGGERSSEQERYAIKKEEIQEKLDSMNAEENRRREEIEALIELMEKPNEQTVVEMHYLDNIPWRLISVAIWGEMPDYDENERRYLKRTFKIHGSALQSLAKIYKRQATETSEGEAGT